MIRWGLSSIRNLWKNTLNNSLGVCVRLSFSFLFNENCDQVRESVQRRNFALKIFFSWNVFVPECIPMKRRCRMNEIRRICEYSNTIYDFFKYLSIKTIIYIVYKYISTSAYTSNSAPVMKWSLVRGHYEDAIQVWIK